MPELTLEEHIAAIEELAQSLTVQGPNDLVAIREITPIVAALGAVLAGAKQLQDQALALRSHPMLGGLFRQFGGNI